MVRRRRARLFQPHVYLRPRSTVVPDQLDGKRPTLSCDLRHVVRSQSAVWRLFAQVDFRREMRPIAFVDPEAFPSTDLAELLQADFWPLSFGILCQQRCIHSPYTKGNFCRQTGLAVG